MIKTILLGIIVGSLVGCGPSPQEATQMTETNLRTPQIIGKLPDGRDLKLVVVVPSYSAHHHYVYFVDDSVTVNHSVSSGKTTRNAVEALIAPNASVEEIIAKAKELENKQALQDESEYNRLKQKLGK